MAEEKVLTNKEALEMHKLMMVERCILQGCLFLGPDFDMHLPALNCRYCGETRNDNRWGKGIVESLIKD